MKWSLSIEALAAAALVAAVGCHSSSTQPPLLHGEHFVPDDQPHAVDHIAAAQAARGARADATLRPVHFNDAGLNSLGRQKLEFMLADEDAAQPVVVYLDLPPASDPAPARQAVADYFKARGLAENQFRLVDGPNPKTLSPSTDALTGLAALQQQTPGGQASANPQQSTSGYGSQPGYGSPPGATDNMSH